MEFWSVEHSILGFLPRCYLVWHGMVCFFFVRGLGGLRPNRYIFSFTLDISIYTPLRETTIRPHTQFNLPWKYRDGVAQVLHTIGG